MSRETDFAPPSLTSLSRDQLIHVVRAHEERRDSFPRTPRAAKKAKCVKDSTLDDDDDDDLEGFLAKAKASLGIAKKCDENDLSSPLRVKDDDAMVSSSPHSWSKVPSRSFRSVASGSTAAELDCLAMVSSSPHSWSKVPSRSFRSVASGSTAAELDCLVSIATPPGLLRNTSTSFARPGNPQLAMMEEEETCDDDKDEDDDDDCIPTDYDPVTQQFSC